MQKKVCEKLHIPHYTFSCKEDFKEHVINDFITCYSNCKTPNPCIECNRYIKFGYMYEKAKELDVNMLQQVIMLKMNIMNNIIDG